MKGIDRLKTLVELCFLTITLLYVALGCALPSALAGKPRQVRLGISGGTQTLWLSLVTDKERAARHLETEVFLSVFPHETALRDAFLKREVDIIATLPPAVPALSESGIDVKFIAPISWIREGYMFITPSDSAITSLSQLVGKQVATYPRGHPGFAYWQAFLWENYGLRLDLLRAVESEMPEQLLQGGEFAAAVTGSAQWSALKGTGAFRKISDLNWEWKKISGAERLLMFGGYVARSDFVASRRAFVDRFIQLNYELLREYQSNKAAVLGTISEEKSPFGLTREQNEFIAWYLGLDDVDPRRVFMDEDDVRDYEVVYALLRESGFLRAPVTSVRDLFYLKGS